MITNRLPVNRERSRVGNSREILETGGSNIFFDRLTSVSRSFLKNTEGESVSVNRANRKLDADRLKTAELLGSTNETANVLVGNVSKQNKILKDIIDLLDAASVRDDDDSLRRRNNKNSARGKANARPRPTGPETSRKTAGAPRPATSVPNTGQSKRVSVVAPPTVPNVPSTLAIQPARPPVVSDIPRPPAPGLNMPGQVVVPLVPDVRPVTAPASIDMPRLPTTVPVVPSIDVIPKPPSVPDVPRPIASPTNIPDAPRPLAIQPARPPEPVVRPITGLDMPRPAAVPAVPNAPMPDTRPAAIPDTRPATADTDASDAIRRNNVSTGVGRQTALSGVVGGGLAAIGGGDTGDIATAAGVGAGIAATAVTTINFADSAIKQRLAQHVSSSIAARVLTKIPVAGLIASLLFSGQRAYAGDWVGAGLELSAGVAGALGPLTFGAGTGVALGIDATSIARDAYSAFYGTNIEDDPQSAERLAALRTAIGETILELIANRPTPTMPTFNDQTRAQLEAIYRDESSYSFLGPDVINGIRGLLALNTSGSGLQANRARESMTQVLSQIQNRFVRSQTQNAPSAPVTRSLSVPQQNTRPESLDNADDSSDLPYPENIIDMLAKTEFNEIEFEADETIFDGEISVTRQEAVTPNMSASGMTTTDTSSDIPMSATPVSLSTAGSSRGVSLTGTSTSSAATSSMATAMAAPASTTAPSEATSPQGTTPVGSEMAMPSIGQTPVTAATPAATSSSAPAGDSSQGQITQILQEGPGFNVVKYSDGRVERRTGSFNWRNNNPGNLRMTPFSRSMGAIGGATFAIFPTYEAGKRAKEALIFESGPYRNLTIAQAISRYAPAFENNTAGYINSIVQATGATPDTPTRSLTPAQRTSMLNAIDRIEGFRVGRVEVLQQPTTAAAQAVPGAPTVDGGALNRVGTEVAAVDQARARASGGSQTTVITPPAVNPAPTNIRSTTHGEVPLNRRLETQAI
jgi:hypothetical protein